MVDRANFTWSDEDMIGVQRAGWSWLARPRNLLVLAVALAVYAAAVLLLLNWRYGTRPTAADAVFAIGVALVLALLVLVLIRLSAVNHGRQVLANVRERGRQVWAGHGAERLLDGQSWAWDDVHLRIRTDAGTSHVPWTSVDGWLDGPDALLLFPPVSRLFAPVELLPTAWRDAPTLFLFPTGQSVLALPRRAGAGSDFDDLIGTLDRNGVRERRRFGVLASPILRDATGQQGIEIARR